ncbi:hypothetical protein [Streptomyces tsukubensis]|uniref:Transmembrane protein n=1 Tax=Streptomyces tsukubensis TaxID=83656 RepID=A0A1V4A9E5_9ACTN|nr:hypothetical protein [Streptomyces tsukubensis]OON79222.1 hypothetical protein B1H18_14790 [Streptomyces tsukubensis]QFR94659.1 hypothetical protein GBW32_18405 [Streptomyces tsukubensis]
MHMNSAPHLLNEDRPEYERILDEALHITPDHPDLATKPHRLNPEQLRTMALNASALITAAAATEYQHYVKVREQFREPAGGLRGGGSDESGATAGTPGPLGLGVSVSGVTEAAGAGIIAVVAVLAPVLAGTAAVIFLLVGYILKMLTPEPAIATTLITAGSVFGVLTAVAILIAGAGLLLTALRNGSTSVLADTDEEQDAEVERAREAWRQALLERGMLPFLREAETASGTVAENPVRRAGPQRMPNLGYNRPGFSSPEENGASGTGTRPSFSSPDFSSPDYGGPEHRPD